MAVENLFPTKFACFGGGWTFFEPWQLSRRARCTAVRIRARASQVQANTFFFGNDLTGVLGQAYQELHHLRRMRLEVPLYEMVFRLGRTSQGPTRKSLFTTYSSKPKQQNYIRDLGIHPFKLCLAHRRNITRTSLSPHDFRGRGRYKQVLKVAPSSSPLGEKS